MMNMVYALLLDLEESTMNMFYTLPSLTKVDDEYDFHSAP